MHSESLQKSTLMMECPVVSVAEGKLKGSERVNLDGKKFYGFLGIPYGRPPIGELRFKAPTPAEPWDGLKDATVEAKHCFQRNEMTQEIDGSEDCLNLNVFTKTLPSEESNVKPVMVWIHGGGFTKGSNSTQYFGPEFLMLEDIVLVTVNYRLGYLGFLQIDDPSLEVPGNAGLKDQMLALKWIQRNIDMFNGNPNNVTLFGTSAGGVSVHYHVMSPAAKGLFHKAIVQSGCIIPFKGKCNVAVKLVNRIDENVETEKEALKILRKLSVEELFDLQEKFLTENTEYCLMPIAEKPNPTAFLATCPEEALIAGDYNKVPLMMGSANSDGILLLALKKADEDTKGSDGGILHHFDIENFITLDEDDSKTKMLRDKINEFYFHENKDNNYVQWGTDCSFLVPTITTAKLHVKTSPEPVYLYSISIDAGLNFFKRFYNFDHLPGAAHSDEIGYLFNVAFAASKMEMGEFEVVAIKRFVKLWTNFAKYSDPTPDENELNVRWKPVETSNLYCLDIGKELTLRSNPIPETLKLWKEIYQINPSTCEYLE